MRVQATASSSSLSSSAMALAAIHVATYIHYYYNNINNGELWKRVLLNRSSMSSLSTEYDDVMSK